MKTYLRYKKQKDQLYFYIFRRVSRSKFVQVTGPEGIEIAQKELTKLRKQYTFHYHQLLSQQNSSSPISLAELEEQQIIVDLAKADYDYNIGDDIAKEVYEKEHNLLSNLFNKKREQDKRKRAELLPLQEKIDYLLEQRMAVVKYLQKQFTGVD